jgi:hypothetical protein
LDFFASGMAAIKVWIMSENSASSRQFGRWWALLQKSA